MIDLHCHILPGLDDGARDEQDSLAMARQAQQDGIAAVCATPHIRHDHRVDVTEIAPRASALQDSLAANGVELLILPGGELAQAQADRLSDAQLRIVSLGGAGAWVLLEPSPGPLTDELRALVGRLASRGLRCVIAHPERHAGADFVAQLKALAAGGCLIQWTAQFVAQALAGDLLIELAEQGLVHLLGSDAHSSRAGRPVRLSGAFARLAEIYSPERIAWTREQAPRAIVRGEALTPPP